MQASAPVSVASLRLKGDGTHKDALLAGLDDVHWPAAHGREYVIVRQLRVRAAWWQAVEAIGQDTRALVAGAVSGWSSQAKDAAAVRFVDLADLVACLSYDLARGQAAGLWYWQAWARVVHQPAPAGLAQLWSEHAALLPDLVARLNAHAALAATCAPLDDHAIAHVLDGARHATGWPLGMSRNPPLAPVPPDAPAQPRPDLHDWQAVRDLLPARQLHALAPLMALTSGWLQIPQRLHDDDAWSRWLQRVTERVARHLAGPSCSRPHVDAAHAAPEPPTHRARQPGEAAASGQTRADDRGRPLVPGNVGRKDARRIADDGTPRAMPGDRSMPPTVTLAGGKPVDRTRHPEASGSTTGRTASPPNWQAEQAADGPPSDADLQTPRSPSTAPVSPQPPVGRDVPPLPGDARTPGRRTDTPQEEVLPESWSFHTSQGGLFYLLNVLAHPAISPALADSPEPGWQRLYRLGVHLGLACDPPLARFLAHKLELPDVGQLADLPPLQAEPLLLQLADRHFAHLPVWGRQLLAVPAQAVYTRSHLDLYYPLAAVRLEVRRAGLDIDPGWLPWLGQVVHFHYRDDHAQVQP